jgi:hypothetical protein
MAEPERKRAALEKRAATRAALGPRTERSKSAPRVVTVEQPLLRLSRVRVGKAHPTRDARA